MFIDRSSDYDGIRAFSRFLLILLLFLLLIRYYTGRQGNNFILVAVSILVFFIIMLNPFVILAIFVALIYSLFLLYPMMNQEREDTNLIFEEVVTVKREKNRWFGNLHHFSSYQTCRFDDINLFRLMGKDTIHLEHVILSNHDNVIILRKLVGTTRIIVPVDVEVSLSVNSLYGDLTFFDQPKRSLRNEQFHQETRDYLKSPKSVKILLTTMVGDVEVVRG